MKKKIRELSYSDLISSNIITDNDYIYVSDTINNVIERYKFIDVIIDSNKLDPNFNTLKSILINLKVNNVDIVGIINDLINIDFDKKIYSISFFGRKYKNIFKVDIDREKTIEDTLLGNDIFLFVSFETFLNYNSFFFNHG